MLAPFKVYLQSRSKRFFLIYIRPSKIPVAWSYEVASTLGADTKGKRISRPKIGIYLSTIVVFHHIETIVANLPEGDYEFIPGHWEEKENKKIMNYLDEMGMPYCHSVSWLLLHKQQYHVLISNIFPVGLNPTAPHTNIAHVPELQRLLGKKLVRMVYSMGKSGWNFSEWNKFYDLILCYGPEMAGRFTEKFPEVKIAPVGYPRLDCFFQEHSALVRKVQRIYKVDEEVKTILWLPTWGRLSSLGLYLECVAALVGKVRVLLKPHPLENKELLTKAIEAGITVIDDEKVNNVSLLAQADFVFCDYGGSVFASLYCDKNIVLFNLDNPIERDIVNLGDETSFDLLIRESILNIDINQAGSLNEIILDPDVWEEQKKIRNVLRKKYFMDNYGDAGKDAAGHISSIFDEINGAKQVKKASKKAGNITKYLYRIFLIK
jgi:hypothetical protein